MVHNIVLNKFFRKSNDKSPCPFSSKCKHMRNEQRMFSALAAASAIPPLVGVLDVDLAGIAIAVSRYASSCRARSSAGEGSGRAAAAIASRRRD